VAAFLDRFGAPALTFYNSTTFPDAGGYLISAPAVAQAQNGDTYIVGLDGAGGVQLNSFSWAERTWNGWQHAGGILDPTGRLTATVDRNGVVWFTGRDTGNRFWINYWSGGSFGGWICLDGIFAPDAVPQIAALFGSIYVVGKDIGGRVWWNSYNTTSQTLTGWVDLQAVIVGQPSVTASDNRSYVYVAVRTVSSNSPVYITQIPQYNNTPANTWLNGGGLVDTDPQITAQNGAVVLVAEAGGDTVYFQAGHWYYSNGILNDSTIAAAPGNVSQLGRVYIAGRDGAERIYWYKTNGANGGSWLLAGGGGVASTPLTGAK
jgi:hypothetical protein